MAGTEYTITATLSGKTLTVTASAEVRVGTTLSLEKAQPQGADSGVLLLELTNSSVNHAANPGAISKQKATFTDTHAEAIKKVQVQVRTIVLDLNPNDIYSVDVSPAP